LRKVLELHSESKKDVDYVIENSPKNINTALIHLQFVGLGVNVTELNAMEIFTDSFIKMLLSGTKNNIKDYRVAIRKISVTRFPIDQLLCSIFNRIVLEVGDICKAHKIIRFVCYSYYLYNNGQKKEFQLEMLMGGAQNILHDPKKKQIQFDWI
jgi:hypothetical protein